MKFLPHEILARLEEKLKYEVDPIRIRQLEMKIFKINYEKSLKKA
tara:strand:- start:313 stop:447 length:135 start_codon:yes stop_codon:yes gene_type:complete